MRNLLYSYTVVPPLQQQQAGRRRGWKEGRRDMDAIRARMQAATSTSVPRVEPTTQISIMSTCKDLNAATKWADAVCCMQSCLWRFQDGIGSAAEANESGLALNEAYATSAELVALLQRPPYEIRAAPLVNPLLMICRQVLLHLHKLLLLRLRVAPKLPPEVWSIVVSLAFTGVRGEADVRRSLVCKYGYVHSGSLRVKLRTISLPRAATMRSGLASAMNTIGAETDPERVASMAASFLADREHRAATERLTALLDAFGLPLPEHMLLSPPVGLGLAVDAQGRVTSTLRLRVRSGWVST